MNVVGKSVTRRDARSKVCGKTKYTDDFNMDDMLHGKVKRSTIAAGRVKRIDTSKAEALDGVVAVFTYKDVPDIRFPTAGHPWSRLAEDRDIEDRLLLTGDIHFYGDEIAVAVAVDEFTAEKAVELIEIKYEEYEPILTAEEALGSDARKIFSDRGNLIKDTRLETGDLEKGFGEADFIFEDTYTTQAVNHCAMEKHISCAYQAEDGRITVLSSTQIPHVCRRVIGQALGVPWGEIRVVKPAVGGGFGSKQDVVCEPLAAFLTMKLNGRPVKINYSREETFVSTRVRHPMTLKLKTGFKKDGTLTALKCYAITPGGGYASHGHSIITNTVDKLYYLYPCENFLFEAVSTYTNTPVCGAMRGYGAPQSIFMMESHLDVAAKKLGVSPDEIRRKNLIPRDFEDPFVKLLAPSAVECLDKGLEIFRWAERASENQEFNSRMESLGKKIRRGLGMAMFSYNAGVYPFVLEIAGARIVMNQDGSIQLQVGATEIGQGSDTVFAQMAAEIIGIPYESVHVISSQDTDISPFDTGAYASRQTYVAGSAVKRAAEEVRDKLLAYAADMLSLPVDGLRITDAQLTDTEGNVLMPLSELVLDTYYNKKTGCVITADVSENVHSNAPNYGTTFVQTEVDMALGQVKILNILNVHDAGTVINPALAEAQVHGGVSMAIGYALSEEIVLNKDGATVNGSFLDYKLPTASDMPNIDVAFVDNYEPTGPFGNKSLGEPPAISPAPAIRNAVYDATGVAVNDLPLKPQRLVAKFKEAGLI